MERGRSGSVGAPGVHGSVVITVRSRVRMTHAGGGGGGRGVETTGLQDTM